MPHPRLVALLFVAAIATGSSLAVASPSHAADNPIYQIQSDESGKCLQPVNGSLGAAIVQETCNGSVAQQWMQETSPYYGSADWFVNSSSGLCLDVRGGDTNGAPIEQWACDKISNERWRWLIPVGSTVPDGLLESGVKPYHWDECISTPGPVNGDAMVLYSDAPELPSEFWTLTAI
jgi:Ricin-type beta-trefoil lectin domain-like